MIKRSRLVYAALLLGLLAFDAAIPLASLANRSAILSEGETVRLQLAVRDPRDLFRGEYSRLSYEIGDFSGLPVAQGQCAIDGCAERFEAASASGGDLYVGLALDKNGVARPTAVSLDQPSEGVFIRGRISRNHVATVVERGKPIPVGAARFATTLPGGEPRPATCEAEACVTARLTFGIEVWYGPQGEPAKLDLIDPKTLTALVAVAKDGSAALRDVQQDGRSFLPREN